ncbi:MAG TPA: hypothetical protein VH877_07700 [Polyangia bacterium]|jgi:hypothetical protein|nr:hypothetical protein [Polyangia bacterium]
MGQLAAFFGQLTRLLALALLFLTYPVFVLPRSLWNSHQARRRLRTYGPPVVLADGWDRYVGVLSAKSQRL